MRRLILAAALAALSGSAFAAGTFTIYTYESFTSEWGPGPKVKEAFEKTCDCEVDYVSLADGVALLTRLKMEARRPRPISCSASTPI